MFYFEFSLSTSHIQFLLKVRVLAEDQGTPPLSDTTVVTVKVDRNLNAPQTERSEWVVSVLETQALGVTIVQVQGSDQDQRVRDEGIITC